MHVYPSKQSKLLCYTEIEGTISQSLEEKHLFLITLFE